MKELQIALKVISLFLEVFLGLFLFSRMFLPRQLSRRFFWISAYFILYFGLILTEEYWITTWVEDAYPVYLVMHSSLLMIYGFLFCKGKAIFKVFLSLTYVSLITMSQTPGMLLWINLLRPFLDGFPLFHQVPSILGSLTLIAITLFMVHFRLDTQKDYPFSYYCTMIVTPVLNMASLTLLKGYYLVIPYVDLIGSFTLLIELLIYYMIWQSTTEYARRIELQLVSQQLSYQKQHMSELKNIVADYHQLRHDMKNHFACMDRLISQEKYGKLKEYFYSLSKDLYALDNQIETGNEIVNQVINIKYATAHRMQIPMDIQITVPRQLPIQDHLLCSLFSNLLDNAIEASSKVKEPMISVQMNMVKDYLSLTVRNRIEDSQRETALSHKTTKSNPQLHGLGLQIVEEVVRRYHGISTFEVMEGCYVASVMLECV